jgi:hypothetical protein
LGQGKVSRTSVGLALCANIWASNERSHYLATQEDRADLAKESMLHSQWLFDELIKVMGDQPAAIRVWEGYKAFRYAEALGLHGDHKETSFQGKLGPIW